MRTKKEDLQETYQENSGNSVFRHLFLSTQWTNIQNVGRQRQDKTLHVNVKVSSTIVFIVEMMCSYDDDSNDPT